MSNKINKTFAKNASWIMLGRIFQLGLTFISTMIVTRYLGPTEFGKLTYVYSYIQLFLPLCTLGMNDIVVKELVDNRENNNAIIGTISVIRLISSVISMICSIMLVSILNNNLVYKTIAIFQSFSLMFQSFDSIMYFYQSRLLSRKTGLIYVVSYVLTAIFRICAVILRKSYKWFGFAYSLDFIVVSTLLIAIYMKDKFKFVFSFDLAKQLIKKSSPYIFSSLMIVIYGKVTDTLLLGKMVDDTAVGYYGAVTTLCNAWPFILTAIIDSASPMIIDVFKTDKKLYRKRIKQLYASIFYISIFAALGISILANAIIMILYGEQFLPAAIPLRIVCWSTTFAYIGVARSIWMQCEKKTKYETVISLFGAIINVTLNYFLIKSHGIVGASIAIVLTQFLTNFVILFFIKETRENAKLILDAIILKDVFK